MIVSDLILKNGKRVAQSCGCLRPHLAARVVMLAPLSHVMCEVLHTFLGRGHLFAI